MPFCFLLCPVAKAIAPPTVQLTTTSEPQESKKQAQETIELLTPLVALQEGLQEQILLTENTYKRSKSEPEKKHPQKQHYDVVTHSMEEAVFLGHQIIVSGSTPGRIIERVENKEAGQIGCSIQRNNRYGSVGIYPLPAS